MAEFFLPLTTEGAVTAPTGTFALTVPSAESKTYLDIGGVNVLEVAEFGWVVADGVNPLRLITRGTVYDANVPCPIAPPTLAVTGGDRALAYGNYAGQPAGNETFTIGSDTYDNKVQFKTNLAPFGALMDQVKIGVDANTTYANLMALINQTGTNGVEYYQILHKRSPNYWLENKIEVVSVDTGDTYILFRYTDYGSIGNNVALAESVTNFAWQQADLSTGISAMYGGSDGTGTAPEEGTYRYFITYMNSVTGAETGHSPIATITKDSNVNVTVGGLVNSPDTTFDYFNIYRTTKEGVEFFLLGSTGRANTSFLDELSDEDLVARNAAVAWNDFEARAYVEGVPPRGLALALWKGRVWTTGARLHAEFSKGTVSVTKGSASVTFSALGITSRMVSRTLRVDATAEAYRILSLTESTGVAILEREYEGTTNGTASYTGRDDYDAAAVRACIPGRYGQWAEDDSPGRVDTDDPAGGTALLATRSRLFAFSKTSIIGITGDDLGSWERSKVIEGVGCVGPNMVVGMEGGGFFLSPDGFYSISSDETIYSISSPKSPKRTIPQGIDGTVARIAWANIDQGYAEYDPTDRVVIWGLPLDGATSPNYEVIMDLQNGAWMLYKRAQWCASAQVTLASGGQAMIAGDREGHLWHAGIGESDGFYGAEAVQTLSGAQTKRVLTVSGTPFTTSEDGKPVLILYADGVTVAYGKVASSTTSALTLTEDLDTAPAAYDQIILGGIAWQAKSGFATFGEEYRSKTLRSVTIRHAPTTRGEYFLSFAVNGGSFTLCPVGSSLGDLSDATGKVKHRVQWPGDTHAINLRGFKPGGQAVLRGGVFDVVVRENGGM